MGKIELLCPAGSTEALIAAVENGADSVYLGGKEFNARVNANNFSINELNEGIRYCHQRDIKVYMTVNTLVNDKEIPMLVDYLAEVNALGIDSVIVQDLAIAQIVRKYFPHINLHASTQMTIYNLDGVKILQELGFSRVVLARELTSDEITYICNNSDIEVEVFVHGALCFSYSGQCLMSSFIGGRSGNRGKCAQPCRLPYRFVDENKINNNENFLISPKDLCLIEKLDELRNAGVSSLKIEGRMKRDEYVAQVTSIFRKYIDNKEKISKEDYEKLLQIYNRGEFTKGYFDNIKNKELISSKRPNHYGVYIGKILEYNKQRKEAILKTNRRINKGDVIEVRDGYKTLTIKSPLQINQGTGKIPIKKNVSKSSKVFRLVDSEQISMLQGTITKNIKKIPIWGMVNVENKRLKLTVNDEKNNEVKVLSSKQLEQAQNKPIDSKVINFQIKKLGDTPFYFENLDVIIDDVFFIPLSILNEMRREAIEKLLKKRSTVNRSATNIDKSNLIKKSIKNKKVKEKILIQYDSIVNLSSLPKEKFDILDININDIIENKNKCSEIVKECKIRDIEVECIVPPVFKQNIYTIDELIHVIKKIGINSVKIGNISQIQTFNKYKDIVISGDLGLNVFNSLTIDYYVKQGFKSVALSPELSLNQIKDLYIGQGFNCECIVYGKLPLIISEAKIYKEGKYNIEDRKNIFFPVKVKNYSPHTIIYNSVPLFYTEGIKDLTNNGVNMFRIFFTDESETECNDIIKIYNHIFNDTINESINNRIEKIKSKGFTNGHFKKEV